MDDEARIERFFASLGENSARFFNDGGGNERRTMEFFRDGKPDHVFTVTEHANEIVALAFYWDFDRAIPWFGIAVSDPWQKKGIGSELLRERLDSLTEKGYGGLLLRTAGNNLPARKLYERFGFERIGIHPSGELLYLNRFSKT